MSLVVLSERYCLIITSYDLLDVGPIEIIQDSFDSAIESCKSAIKMGTIGEVVIKTNENQYYIIYDKLVRQFKLLCK